jgi:hypothetical protein
MFFTTRLVFTRLILRLKSTVFTISGLVCIHYESNKITQKCLGYDDFKYSEFGKGVTGPSNSPFSKFIM